MRLVLCLLLVGCPGPTGGTDTDDADTDGDTASIQTVNVRVVTWNIEGPGSRGSTEGDAERAILARIDADVVAINEVNDDESRRLTELATDLGYDTVFLPSTNPYGSLRNAVLTRLPVVEVGALQPSALSGDSRADDVTRLPIRLTVEVPGASQDLTVVNNHWKSGFDVTDRFRRTLDGIRTAQAADGAPGDRVLIMGDMNAELEDMPESPARWTSVPSGLPNGYRLGQDQRDVLSEGIDNSAFAALQARGFTPLEAAQLDGRYDTRPVSSRRIDWVFVSPSLSDSVVGEVYDSTDEGQASGIDKVGDPPPRSASRDASDHLPIIVDVALPKEG